MSETQTETGERRDRRNAGTHEGHLEGEGRQARSSKNARNRGHRGEAARRSCAEYPSCDHRKHGRG